MRPTIPRKIPALILAAVLGVAITATAQPTTLLDVTFGSNNDGLGGFTQSTAETNANSTTSWATNSTNVASTNANTSGTGNANNNSLLRSVSLNRSVGYSYQITGVMNWSAEADRNNRQGIYLFGDFADLTAPASPGPAGPQEDETGALSFLYNSDDQDILHSIGIDQGGQTGVGISNPNVPATNSYYTNEPLTFQADIDFVNNGGTDQIEIEFTMFNDFGGTSDSDSISHTVDAADYLGDYFGFVGRTRDDGAGNSVAEYESFSIVQTAIPEPSTFALMVLAIGAGAYGLKRQRS